MRICLVSSSFYPATFYGGPISATWDLSKKLASKGVEIYVSTTNANGSTKLDVEHNMFLKKQDNLFVKYYNEQIINKISYAFIFGIWNDIKKSDIVYIQYLFHYTVLFSLLFGMLQNKKIFICPRGSLAIWGMNYKLQYVKKLWVYLFIRPFYKSVIWQASSYLEKEDIKRNFSKARVEIINDGVDFDSFQDFQKISKELLLYKFTKQKFETVSNLFFSMGRLHKIKGFDVLIDAFSKFSEKNINAKLLIAGGDDGEKEHLEQKISKLRISKSVFLIGEIGFVDKKILLNNCDYFTLSSEFESFGIVVAEALACGKPIVLSNKTPWKDLEINNCGILADNDKESFFNAFVKIVNEKYDRKNIKNYLKSNYDWEIIVARFIKILKNK
jgi:glycosyltransferase involved in cell wall biosynthesis